RRRAPHTPHRSDAPRPSRGAPRDRRASTGRRRAPHTPHRSDAPRPALRALTFATVLPFHALRARAAIRPLAAVLPITTLLPLATARRWRCRRGLRWSWLGLRRGSRRLGCRSHDVSPLIRPSPRPGDGWSAAAATVLRNRRALGPSLRSGRGDDARRGRRLSSVRLRDALGAQRLDVVMRTSRRDSATRLELGRRSGRGGPRNRHARWDGLHVERAAHRHELSDVGVGDPLWPFVMATEAISRDPDHRVRHGDVPVHVDVGHVDVRGAIHDDVVDDAWPTPAAPRSDPDEARTTPPRNQRFAPGERRPAERPDAETNSHAAAEEDDEGRRVHGPDENRAGRPRPVAADEDPAAVVIGRPAPRRVVEPRPAESSVPDPPTRA